MIAVVQTPTPNREVSQKYYEKLGFRTLATDPAVWITDDRVDDRG